MESALDYFKALHIIFIVSWFAGLFYIVRLFIYHSETKDMEEPKKSILADQYKVMSKRLWYIITWPAMVLASIFGILMVVELDYLLTRSFFIVKLVFVGILYIYHLSCHMIFKQLQSGNIKYTSTQLRIWNELATLLLVAIVFIIVLKSSLNFIWGTVGFFLVGIMLMMGIRLYKRLREHNNKKSGQS